MTDSSPVVKIKDAYKGMLAEIKSMDVRMGVLSHTILQYKSKEKITDKKSKVVDIDELEDLAWFFEFLHSLFYSFIHSLF